MENEKKAGVKKKIGRPRGKAPTGGGSRERQRYVRRPG